MMGSMLLLYEKEQPTSTLASLSLPLIALALPPIPRVATVQEVGVNYGASDYRHASGTKTYVITAVHAS